MKNTFIQNVYKFSIFNSFRPNISECSVVVRDTVIQNMDLTSFVVRGEVHKF